MTLYVILLHRSNVLLVAFFSMQSVIKMPSEGFFQREAVGTLQLAARLKARDGLHSKVVAPESRKRGTKNGKMNAVIYKSAFKKWALLKKE